MVNYFDSEALADAIISLLNDQNLRLRFSKAAREFAKTNYELKTVCLPKQMGWMHRNSVGDTH